MFTTHAFIHVAWGGDVSHHQSRTPQINIPPDSVFHVGEELTYNVSYASFDIGQVRIKLIESVTKDHLSYYKAEAHIDSYRGVPFVDLHAVFMSLMDGGVYATHFESRTKQDNEWPEVKYDFDYSRHTLVISHSVWKTNKVGRRDTLSLDTLSQDGLSLFYFARKYLFTKQNINIPTVVSEKKGNTLINFTPDRRKEEIEAVQYPIDLIHFEGEAGFVGIFGLTGGFEGWFSNDAARVPILAKMKVIIGSVRIELMKWKREGWAPPQYLEGLSK